MGKLLLFMIFFLASACLYSRAHDSNEEFFALLRFKGGLYNPDNDLPDWNASNRSLMCNWTGITCDSSSTHVQVISIYGTFSGPLGDELCSCSGLQELNVVGGLNGSISACFASLTALRVLILSGNDNNMTGNIPKDLGMLSALEVLDLYGTKLSGEIPSALFTNCSVLRYLDFRETNLTGSIPQGITKCSALEGVDMQNTQLSGNITEIFSGISGMFSALEVLDLYGTKLSGEIPSALFTNCSVLRYLDFSETNLTGSIPQGITKCSALEVVYMHNTQLSGNITEIFSGISGMSALTILYLGKNRFTGNIPGELGNCPALKYLDLSFNALTGNIPIELGNCTGLNELSLSSNSLTGNIPEQLGKLSQLSELSLANNFLTGKVPNQLSNLSALVSLDLSANNLTGIIPNVSKLQFLQILKLHGNELSGKIPFEIGNSSQLYYLTLHDNKLHGEIPSNFIISKFVIITLNNNRLTGRIPTGGFEDQRMTLLVDLSSNNFSGPFPKELCYLHGLVILRLAYNNFEGTISECIGNFTSITILDLSNNKLTGNLPQNLTSLRWLQNESYWTNQFEVRINNSYIGTIYISLSNFDIPIQWKHDQRQFSDSLGIKAAILDVSNNELGGSIPSELGNLVVLKGLNLSHNQFSGQIPPHLGNLKDMNSLDLSWNRLSGNIPAGLCIDSLGVFDVSHNNLSGHVPTDNHCDTRFNASAFEGNQLCGLPLSVKCNTTKSKNRDDVHDHEGAQDWNSWFKEYVWNPGFFIGTFIGFILSILFTVRI